MTKLKESINGTIVSGTRAVKEIYENHDRLDDAKRKELIQQTDHTFDVAAEVLVVCDIGNTHLDKHSDDLPNWVKCFKEFIHYRFVLFPAEHFATCFCLYLCVFILITPSHSELCLI